MYGKTFYQPKFSFTILITEGISQRDH